MQKKSVPGFTTTSKERGENSFSSRPSAVGAKSQRGFTLIEILIVIGIIAILAGVVLVAINPARQFAQASDSQRSSNVNAILNAIGQKLADDKGQFTGCLAALDNTGREITVGIATATGLLNLDCLTPTYLPSIPFDPTGTASSTKYHITKDADNRVTVSAPETQIATPDISVKR